MKKYWNALWYGNAKTKRILWSAIGLFVLMVVGGIRAATGGGMLWVLIAIFALIMDIVLLQSVRFGEVGLRAGGEKGKKPEKDIRNKVFESIASITQEDIKQLLVTYKVSKEHVPVMVDYYEEDHIRQSPAYMWKDRGYLQLLILEEKPRNIAISLNRVTRFYCRRDVEVNPSTEYRELRKPSVVNMAYQGLLPTYIERVRRDGRRYYTKNLYVLEPGMELTNTSVRNVLSVLPLPISFDGIVNDRDSSYYQEACRMKYLLMDQVLTPEEYKEQVSGMLKAMADDRSGNVDFDADIERMVRNRLVTREVASYYQDYRKKQDKKKK